jgi:glycosyltransferase involved in cell wall biosynthesis|tara:strand:- start:3424 stop:4866 length:1443 start_codon:yes stop_codon:yes gene_type:complete
MSLSVVFSSKEINKDFIELIKSTSGIHKIEILPYENPGKYSLTEVYNMGLKDSKNDIVLFCHDDIKFDTKNWGRKLVKHFQKSDYGILGVAGCRYLPESGKWWEIPSEMMGQVYHENEGKRWLSTYNPKFGNNILPSVLVDGLFFAVSKKALSTDFDESVTGFHFYDLNFCVQNFLSGVKVGVISDIDITHLSIGQTNQEWERNRILFSEKYEKELPLIVSLVMPELKLKKNNPLVSIIIPVYNYGKTLDRALSSVFAQTYKNLEIIIIDDGSTDNFTKLKLNHLDIPNTKIIFQENGGPSKARNEGVKISTGDYILPLDSDDLIHPTYVEQCIKLITQDKNYSPIYCDTVHQGQMKGIEERPEWSKERLINGPFIVNCSMFSREAFDSIDGYDEDLKGWEDYDMWLRMMQKGYVGKRIPSPLFIYFHHESEGTVSTIANQDTQSLHQKILIKNKLITDPTKTSIYSPLKNNNTSFNSFV